MARSKITPNPPPSAQNPPSQAHNPPRAPGASSSQAERPATSRPNLAQATPPVAGGASVPTPDYKKLYPWASSALLKETSSINSAMAVLRLRKGDQSDLSFHKEHDNLMLGKGKLAELRALARAHGLASGSQTVPNSVVEITVAQGRSPPKGPAPSEAQPAPQRKKLVLRKPKRKTPQVVHEDEEEDDEATEDGLITKRRRVAPSSLPDPPPLPTSTPSSPPAPTTTPPPPSAPTSPVQAVPLAAAFPVIEVVEANFMENPPSASTPYVSAGGGPPSTASIAETAAGGDEGAHNSPIIITESPSSPPRQEAPTQQPTQEGGGENQQQAPPVLPRANLSLEVKRVIEAEKLSCNLMLAEIDHSRVEDAMSIELRVARKEATDLRHRVHLLAQEKIELKSKLVPYRLKVASLEASIKADAAKVENVEKRSVDREVLLGKTEKERDDTMAKLAEAKKENEGVAAELVQAQAENKRVTEDLLQARERAEELKQQNEGLKKQIEELELSSAQILAAGFDAALEQFACQYPDLDLSMVSLNNEVVDGKIVPSED
ncbi:uncharacterized protein [Phaseolus vulgaris]|uniref:uncharacterized protein n=1 Tax=Phaseolus vulgaris TaxID=3885 RepID=UPI0035CB05FB